MARRNKQKNDDPFYKPYTLKAKSDNQIDYIRAINANTVTCATGPAGCGKTHIAVGMAVRHLRNESSPIDKIILARPAVEGGGEHLGYLPGKHLEKVDPFMRPMYDELHYYLSYSAICQLKYDKVLRIEPLAYIRGLTLQNAFVIVDEAQNAMYDQLKMVWTRLGENSRLVISGDIDQSDLHIRDQGGLEELCDIMDGLEGFTHITLDTVDICRHEMVRKMLEREAKHKATEGKLYAPSHRNQDASS